MVKDNRVLKKSILKCRKKDDIELCGFSLTVKTLISDKEGEGKLYVGDFQEARHNHPPPTNRAGIRHLPPKMRREALHMTNSLHFSLPDTIRYLQDKYEIVINPNSVRKMIGYGRSISNPRDLECTKLFKELVSLHQENVENRYYVTHDSEGRMVSACWAFSEWIEDYKTFGVIPGVSVDCKDVANRYGFPLKTINGRSNDGFVLTFFMGFISGETEADFTEVLSQFKSMIPISPAIIAMDQSAACISATEKVFGNSFIVLDEWHLNQNQIRNVTSWCAHIKRTSWCDDMSRDLFNLRRSKTLAIFTERRDEFIRKYFIDFTNKIPVWFTYLYVHRPQLLVACFRFMAVPKRYLFQGTGYTEAYNSGYLAYVLTKKLSISDIPKQLKILTKKRAEERKESLIRSRSSLSSQYRAVRTSMLPLPPAILDELIFEYRSYSLKKFREISVEPSRNYAVKSAYVTELGQVHWPELKVSEKAMLSSVVCFELTWSFLLIEKLKETENTAAESPSSPLLVRFVRSNMETENGPERELHVRCDCNNMESMEFPCRHIIRCAYAYNDLVMREPRMKEVLEDYIEIETIFDPYWRSDSDTVSLEHICKLRNMSGVIDMEALNKQMELADLQNSSNDIDLDRFISKTSEAEVRKHIKWSDNYAIFNQIHRLVEGIGPSAVGSFKDLLNEVKDRFSRGEMVSKAILPDQNTPNKCTTTDKSRIVLADREVGHPIPELLPPTRHSQKIKKRKRRSFTEKFKSKKGRLSNILTDGTATEVERMSQDSTVGSRSVSNQEIIESSQQKAIDIVESVYRQ